VEQLPVEQEPVLHDPPSGTEALKVENCRSVLPDSHRGHLGDLAEALLWSSSNWCPHFLHRYSNNGMVSSFPYFMLPAFQLEMQG
jgi:hypothetical protein